jgi:hypothetical protein
MLAAALLAGLTAAEPTPPPFSELVVGAAPGATDLS